MFFHLHHFNIKTSHIILECASQLCLFLGPYFNLSAFTIPLHLIEMYLLSSALCLYPVGVCAFLSAIHKRIIFMSHSYFHLVYLYFVDNVFSIVTLLSTKIPCNRLSQLKLNLSSHDLFLPSFFQSKAFFVLSTLQVTIHPGRPLSR